MRKSRWSHIAEKTIDALSLKQDRARKWKQRLGIKVPDRIATYSPSSVQKDGFIHIFTDGSCNYKNGLLGTGIVIQHASSTASTIFAKRINPDKGLELKRFGPMTAEFQAVTDALQQLLKAQMSIFIQIIQ